MSGRKRVGILDTRFNGWLALVFVLAWMLANYFNVQMQSYAVGVSTSKESTSSSSTTTFVQHVRKWGCQRNETPLIFVHIGKAGGGQVRARFAAAALEFDRNHTDWRKGGQDEHYYPLPHGGKARFCNSRNRNHRYENSEWTSKTYEGTLPCNATTPLGMALACPTPYGGFCKGCNPRGNSCLTVYVGHNHMGSEFHWLPAGYLQRWWKNRGRRLLQASSNTTSESFSSLELLNQGFQALTPTSSKKNGGATTTAGCPSLLTRPSQEVAIREHYQDCGAPLAARMDAAFHEMYSSSPNYAPFYASLPLHRVILVREPWAWIMSKFFWHKSNQKYIDETTGQRHRIRCHDLSQVGYPQSPKGGWADTYLLTYLAFLCGDDCEQRLERGLMTLPQAETQAAHNLQKSFSVVGLLEETDTFLDMVSARIAYVNMSLNPEVQGERHSSKRSETSAVCTRIYQNPKFQTRFREAVPLMETIEQLYQLAVDVNRAQQQELKECTTTARSSS
jgi:hypothetical protein